jgi:hypothetical protein
LEKQVPLTTWKQVSLADRDLEFLVETVSPGVSDRVRLKHIIRDDDDFRKNFITSDKVFQRLMDDDEILLKISPHLFFEILLRRAGTDLSKRGYTLEREQRMRIAVFDTEELLGLLSEEAVVFYLADMLSSFTRVGHFQFDGLVRCCGGRTALRSLQTHRGYLPFYARNVWRLCGIGVSVSGFRKTASANCRTTTYQSARI